MTNPKLNPIPKPNLPKRLTLALTWFVVMWLAETRTYREAAYRGKNGQIRLGTAQGIIETR